MTPPIDHLDVSDSETVRRHAATFRKARLARLAAVEAKRDAPSDELPPRVPARDASSDEVPRGAKAIAKHARAHGWRVREMYALGTTAELLVVRCERRSGDKPSDESSGWVSPDGPSDEFRWACAMYVRQAGASWVLQGCLLTDHYRYGPRAVNVTVLRAHLAGLAEPVRVR